MLMESEKQSGKHTWLPEEDAILVDCLVDMRLNNKYISENGFRPGYLQHLEAMMAEKLPGCGLKGNPHIQSRLKTLKSNWQVVYDLLNGTNTSGFRWDPITQRVIASKQVWDEYLKVHKKAAPFKTKSFVHYDSLCIVWAKDRAIRIDAQTAEDVVEEENDINLEDDAENMGDPQLQGENATPDNDATHSELPSTLRSDGTSVSRKRRISRLEKDEPIGDVLERVYAKMDRGLQQATDKICTQMSRLAYEAAMHERVERLYEDLLKVPNLTSSELIKAHGKLSTNTMLLVGFSTIPDHLKAEWIRFL